MPGIVYVVATPIGNLEDVTLRAIRTLREADLICAEDTRRTAKLLNHLGIATRATSLHVHNESHRIPALLERLAAGDRLALVTDAGTPTISDPGNRFIAAAIDQGHTIVPVPGPNAVAAALSASGFAADEFNFRGFAPTKLKERQAWLRAIASSAGTSVFFEAPHRVARTLSECAGVFGDRPMCVCRELTKLHEEIVRGTASSLAVHFREPRGEFTIVLGPALAPSQAHVTVSGSELLAEFCRLTELKQFTSRDAVASLAAKYGISRQDVYKAVRREE